MQWLIDIIKDWIIAQGYATMAWVIAQGYATEAWVESQGYLTTSYVDRGDALIEDFDLGDLTTDNVWHDLNLTGIVPPEAKAVALSIILGSAAAGSYFRVRKHGNIRSWVSGDITLPVALIATYSDTFCALGAGCRINYRATNDPWFFINITVKGWWL